MRAPGVDAPATDISHNKLLLVIGLWKIKVNLQMEWFQCGLYVVAIVSPFPKSVGNYISTVKQYKIYYVRVVFMAIDHAKYYTNDRCFVSEKEGTT